MHVADLGPLAVSDGEVTRAIPGLRTQTLLGRLLVEAPRWVSASALIEAVWAERAGTDRRPALDTLLWRVRGHLAGMSGQGSLVSTDGHYRLDLTDDQVDSARLLAAVPETGRLLDAGRPAAAAELAASVLALWRGDFLGSLGDQTWAEARGRALDEATERLHHLRWAALLQTGDLAAVLAETADWTVRHPLSEAAWALRIRAQLAAGRIPDALASYRAVRTHLVTELGTEPGEELRRLHRAVLQGDAPPPATTDPRPEVVAVAGPEPVLPWTDPLFLGRDVETARVLDLLDGHRLVTVAGSGGAGKTTLAVQVARRWAETAVGVVRFADLSFVGPGSVPDGPALASVIVSTLGLSTAGTGLDPLLRAVERHRTLLVLDNCEQVAATCAHLLAALLSRAPTVRVLLTSRVPLEVPGEALCRLAPLGDADAAVLLRRRLELAGVPRKHGDEAAVGAICAAVDNLPLGLDLAAARARTFDLIEVARSLTVEPERVVRAGPGPYRHRSLISAVDWSVRGLTSVQRILLGRLSAFDSPFDLPAAEQVCTGGAVRGGDVANLLAELVRQSLVVPAGPPGPGRSWFRLLVPVRAVARRELRRSGDLAVTTHRLDATLSAVLSARPRAVADGGWLDRFDLLWPTVRAALPRLTDDRPTRGALATAVCLLGVLRHRSAEALAVLDGIVASPAGAGDPVVAAATEVVRTYRADKWTVGGAPAAVSAARILVDAVPGPGHDQAFDAAEMAVLLAVAAWRCDAYSDADRVLEVTAPLITAVGDPALELAHRGIGHLNHLPADDPELFATSLAGARADHPRAVACGAELAAFLAEVTRAVAATIQGRPAEALAATGGQLGHFLAWGNRDLGDQLEQRAVLLAQTGRFAPAARFFGAAAAERARSGLGGESLGRYSDLAQDAARSTLGDGFAAEWSAGRSRGAALLTDPDPADSPVAPAS
ncbi:putative ATPase [Nakamurella flavida]|uniref:ATP-binding protein n=1 Tax=Nakamurella flavida TaxID=363630 RepID=UPI00278A4CE7|nr:BTAD domain-containing putative transcriptional regulator [Nakamurella flavida]MDP9778460.1 putative ATPase [Nakamurella flavida]